MRPSLSVQPPRSSSAGAETFSEVKKGVLSVIDNSYLLTPPCLASIAHKVSNSQLVRENTEPTRTIFVVVDLHSEELPLLVP